MKTYPESRLTDLLIEFDEMGFSPTTVCPNPEQAAIEWKEQVVKEIQNLQAEVAELCARLEKAVELPSGDRVWYIAEDEEGQESYIVPKPTSSLTVEELKCAMGRKYLSTRDAAEARLKEIKENAELRAKLEQTVELPCAIGETVYTVIKNCYSCKHYNVSWAECRAPATANFDCESTRRVCFMQDIIEDECKKHLFVAELKFDLGLLDPITGELKPQYFIDGEVAEARLKELKEEMDESY